MAQRREVATAVLAIDRQAFIDRAVGKVSKAKRRLGMGLGVTTNEGRLSFCTLSL